MGNDISKLRTERKLRRAYRACAKVATRARAYAECHGPREILHDALAFPPQLL